MSYQKEQSFINEPCPDCGGWLMSGKGDGSCSDCLGSGQIKGTHIECDSCLGSGVCPTCNGSGVEEKD